MEAVKIYVNKQIDGYNFSILPSAKRMIKNCIPNSYPANNIFVAYDTQGDFEVYTRKLETYIYPALLGIENRTDLHNKIDGIQFIDTQTGKTLQTIAT